MFNINELKPRRKIWAKTAGIPAKRLGWTLDDCTDTSKAEMAQIKRWVKAVEEGRVIRAVSNEACGKGLLFTGRPGHGKTTLALSIIQEMITKFPLTAFDPPADGVLIRPVYFLTYNDFLELKGAMIDGATPDQEALFYGILGECLDDSYNIRVLVLDDVGREHSSDSNWQKNQLHHILRTRFNKGLPTIVTSNKMLEDWAGPYGDATASFAKEAFAYLPIVSEKGDLR